VKLQYLYKDGSDFYFMNEQNYEQFPISEKVIGKQAVLLKENMTINSLCIDDRPVSLEFPRFVELKVMSTPPGTKGNDSNYKEAELENGLVVMVPQFIKEGEIVRLDTETFAYLERVPVKSMKTPES
jgi:elongation factor P